jgi:TonB-dependent receptor
VSVNPAINDIGAFPLRRLRIRDEDITEDLNAVRADLRVPVGDNEDSFIKMGGKYTHRHKVRDNRQSEYLPVGAITSITAGSVLPPPEDFYDGKFVYGPTIDYRAFINFFEANPGRFVLNQTATFISDRSVDYDIRERITAGYVMGQVEIGALTAIAGVRVEHTDARNRAFAIRDTDGDGTLEPSDIQPLTFDNNYTDVLPSIHLNYRPRRDLVLRAAWTNALGRPNYDVSVPTFTEDDGEGTAGNPELLPFRSLGLDLSAEYYPDSESIVSAAIFYKKIRNPIFTRTIQDTSFAGIPLISLSQPQNADDGYLLGIEGNFQRRLTFLPAPLDGLGLSVNGTYVKSEVEVPGRENETIPFFRQSDWILNAAIFYEKGPFEARLAVNYRDDFIVNIGSSVASDIYNKARTVLDARVSYQLIKGAEIFGTLSNFTDAPLTFYQTRPDQIYSRQIYSYYANIGLSLSF